MRKFLVSVFILMAFASLASAQVPTSGNVFFGYSFYNTDLSSIDRANTNGWEATLEGKVLPWVGIVADFDGHYGSQNFAAFCPPGDTPCTFNADVTEHNVLFGPRVGASIGRFHPFAEAMIGIGHVNVHSATTDTSLATALGGGMDYKIFGPAAWRLQADYVHTRFFDAHQNNLRISTGIVLRF